MATIDTGWVAVQSGNVTQINLPGGRIVSAKVRWRGKRRTVESSDHATASASGAMAGGNIKSQNLNAPTVPSGWDFSRQEARSTVYAGASGSYTCLAQISPEQQYLSGTGTGATAVAMQSDSFKSQSGHSVYHAQNYSWAFEVTTYYSKTTVYQTTSPRITINGQVTSGPSSLLDGVVSNWYDISGLVPGTIHQVLHTITGSNQADVQIEIVYIPSLVITAIEPLPFGRATRLILVFRAAVTQPGENSATAWWPQVCAGQDPVDLDCLWDATADQTGWEYWDGEAWVSLTSAGAPLTAACRLTPDTAEMGLGKWYWQARAYDDDTEAWSTPTEIRQFRLVLSVTARFLAEIDSVDVSPRVQRIVISETTNGELGSMTFELHVPGANDPPEPDDPVQIALRDVAGNEEQYEGWVRELPARIGQEMYAIECKLPDSILAERYILQDYTSQDVGLTAKAIIDTYCAPLDSAGVNTSTGFARPVAAFGQTPLDVLKELREQYGLLFWVRGTDQVVFLVNPADLAQPTIAVTRGQPL